MFGLPRGEREGERWIFGTLAEGHPKIFGLSLRVFGTKF